MEYYALKCSLGYVQQINVTSGWSVNPWLNVDNISSDKDRLKRLADALNVDNERKLEVVQVDLREVEA